MITHSGLPPIIDTEALPTTYSSFTVSRYAWLAETWWWSQARREYDAAIARVVAGREWTDPQWAEVGRTAMATVARVGSWGIKAYIAWADAHRGKRKPAAQLRTVRMAAEVDWTQLDGETYEQFADRVFTPLREAVYGVPVGFVDEYVATRIPPIVDATAELRERVQGIMAQSQMTGMATNELEAALQAAGEWPLARVRNQIRTETSTMYNAGRWQHMARDEMVAAYRVVATLDLRTTAFCRAMHGTVIRQGDMQAIPPYHYQCRTIVEPVFEWERAATLQPSEILVPGEGNFANAPYQGFGQRDLVARFRNAT